METREYNLAISNHDFKIKGYWLDQINDFDQPVDYPIVIICPGGGFTFHSGREAEPIALKFNSVGMHAIVLEYKLIDQEPVYPVAVQELGKTIDWIYNQPASRHIDKKKIILVGFSAGGHVIAAYNGIATDPELSKKYQLDGYQGEHAANILGYPVIDMTIKGSFPADDEVVRQVSPDPIFWKAQDLLNSNSKPCFVWQTTTDDLVYVLNSLEYVEKMNQLGLPVEYHMFGSGIHGLSLANYVTQKPGKKKYLNKWAAEWFQLAVNWLKMMKLLG